MNLHEFCGVCEHEFEFSECGLFSKCKKCDYSLNFSVSRSQIDFTTPDGYQILHKAMAEWREWDRFIHWLHRNWIRSQYLQDATENTFHRLVDLTEKVRLLAEYIETLEV